MKSAAPKAGDNDGDAADSGFPPPLTAQQAQAWRSRHRLRPLWQLLVLQALLCVLAALALWWLTGRADWAWSLAYGALAVLAPAALLARALQRAGARTGTGGGADAHALLLGFMAWEVVKLVLTVALLAAAPRLLPGLNWPLLIVGMLLAMKTYWAARLLWPGVRKTDS